MLELFSFFKNEFLSLALQVENGMIKFKMENDLSPLILLSSQSLCLLFLVLGSLKQEEKSAECKFNVSTYMSFLYLSWSSPGPKERDFRCWGL